MNTIRLICLTACLLALAVPMAVKADDDAKPADASKRQEMREKWQKMTPEERKEFKEKHPELAKRMEGQAEDRKEFFKRLGLKPEDMKDLSPEERQAKIKEAVEKKITELKKKKDGGSILTEQEQKDLDTLQKMKDRRPQGRGPKAGPDKKPDDKQ